MNSDIRKRLREAVDTWASFHGKPDYYKTKETFFNSLKTFKDITDDKISIYLWAIDGSMLQSIGYENWDDSWIPYVMKVSVPLSLIDINQTIIQNLNFPNEHEVNLKNNGKGAKFISAKKY
jgi:hypothetical protein